MIIPDSIYNTVRQYPNKIGIVSVDDKIQLTYLEFKQRIDKICTFFQSEGYRKGDKIALLHTNSHLYMEMYYAAAICGLILVPLNHRLSTGELSYMCNDSGVRQMISEYVFREKVEDILKDAKGIEKIIWTRVPEAQRSEFGPKELDYEQVIDQIKDTSSFKEPPLTHDDIAQIYYTSGSTGKPKGVIMSHMNMAFDAFGTIVEYRLTDQDIYIHTAPMFHLTDAALTWAVTWIGGKHILISRFDPEVILRTFEREKVTVAKMVPMMWNQLVNHPRVKDFDYRSMRLVVSGGAPISPSLVQKIMDTFGCEYVQNYGMTETTQFVTISRLKENLLALPPEEQLKYRATTGRPFIGVKLKVVDKDGKHVTCDGKHVGEVMVKGDIVTPGYWNLPEENAKSFEDGWLHTGDMAVMNEEQYITVVDRKKDMIVTGGENVFCIEVENALYKHPAVLEAAVFGVPDEKWGEAVKAVVALKKGYSITEKEVIDFCKNLIAHYKAPKSVDFLDSLPKTGSGKIFKKALKDPYWEGYEKMVHGT
jgi:acyl-CoA synthetase (AMP-forming)/AMP-acid ligase II